VRDDRLRPLPVLERGPETRSRHAWRGWLVPAAAAVSVALVIGLALAVTGGASWRPASGPPAGSGRTTGFPAYFAQFAPAISSRLTLQVRSTSTGSVVASAPSPQPPGWAVTFDAMAASPDGRTFYVGFNASHLSKSPVIRQLWIYRLTITNSSLTRITGGVIPGDAMAGVAGAMAVSPDGTKLALTAATGPLASHSRGSMDKITVIDLRTGARSTWQGGLYRAGQMLTISDISWTANGRSLVFLAMWCQPILAPNLCADASGPLAYRAAQVRSISAGTGGALDRGALLLAQSARSPVIADAVAGPDAGELTLVVLSGRVGQAGQWPAFAVERVSALTGSLMGVEYRSASLGAGQQPHDARISPDPSGRYLLVSYGGRSGFSTGWIDHGNLHYLPISRPYLGYPITAW
jgi:hypothetical protein